MARLSPANSFRVSCSSLSGAGIFFVPALPVSPSSIFRSNSHLHSHIHLRFSSPPVHACLHNHQRPRHQPRPLNNPFATAFPRNFSFLLENLTPRQPLSPVPPALLLVAAMTGLTVLAGAAVTLLPRLFFLSASFWFPSLFLVPIFLLTAMISFISWMIPLVAVGVFVLSMLGSWILPACIGCLAMTVMASELFKRKASEKAAVKSVGSDEESGPEFSFGERDAMRAFDERLKNRTGRGAGVAGCSVDEVAELLRKEGFGGYVRAFKAERVDGSVLLELSEEDFYEIDGKYVPLGDRKRLAAFVERLRMSELSVD